MVFDIIRFAFICWFCVVFVLGKLSYAVVFLQNLLLASFIVWYFGLLTSFSPTYAWILILRGLVGGGMAGMPHG